MQFDSDWEETLNDIDELIQSELRCTRPFHGETQLFSEAGAEQLSAPMHVWTNDRSREPSTDHEWNFTGASGEKRRQLHEATIPTNPEPLNKDLEVNVEVQIIDLKDVYDKKTKKVAAGLEYRLENPVVTVVVRASVEITNVYVHVQRCARAAIRTHDTSGSVELEVSTSQSETNRRVICVDLGSVYKKKGGDHFYWLEKADIAERNKWELTFTIELISGLTASATSRPFRVTTKANYKRGSEDYPSVGKAQNLSCKITVPESQTITNTGVTTLQESRETKLQDTTIMTDDIVCNEVSQDLSLVNLDGIDDVSREDSLEEERLILQPNTVLDRHLVASYYSQEPRIRYVVEQPELPALLKLVAKRSMLVGDRRKKARRKKSTDKNFWWACGHCFFERQKKSTIRAHLIQEVCRKPRLQRQMSKRIRSVSELEHRSELDKYRHDSWKRSISI